ncbi:VanZ family protein [Pelotomaculum isophthalicicum JI]|uniref:VanZ family protein n=1 Tax=Pelotomaculum isophthalicicum JI TaxID=947010 RepID=A0A9X4H3A3_9FIRM|nr:VanZ family protein [Pelotomaculum isophthalicicum]MDF9406797.1 VanZ family protein [Pelotomaculum isophthalicicum JI]
MRRWLLVLACLAAIFYFSAQPFSAQDLRAEIGRHGRIVQKVRDLPPVSFSYGGEIVDNRLNPEDFIQFWLRKGAHFVVYGLLGLAIDGALAAAGLKGCRRWIAAGLFVFLVAVLDEQNQMSVPGRTGRPLDVLVDLAGFFIFTLFTKPYTNG